MGPSMHPEDRVLIGVINRKRDLNHLLNDRWYRIPQERMSLGIHTEYVAFFLSGKPFKLMSGSISYYGRLQGVELHSRRDLLPEEPNHKRAANLYYRLALGQIKRKQVPIINTTKRPIAFIYTTWDRFISARTISDLYSDADHFVDRIQAMLRKRGIPTQQLWDAEQKTRPIAPGLRIPCKDGIFDASHKNGQGDYHLDLKLPDDQIFQEIMAKVKALGGPAIISIPGS